MSNFRLSDDEITKFSQYGYFIVKGLFDQEEIAILRTAIEVDQNLKDKLYNRYDASGRKTIMATWNHPGDSVYGLAARSRRIVDSMETLLGGEVYHYHSKLTAKEPYEGGAWEWHQDYGYWYHNGIVFPHLCSVMVALDRTNKKNGCLQIVKGSHLCGRVEHGVLEGEQVGANARRVEEMLKILPIEYIEMEPGDGVFFHCNALHRSDQNQSDNRRWTVIHCYNLATNNPFLEHHHPFYTPLQKVDDSAIKLAGVRLSDSSLEFNEQSVNPPELTRKAL
ncbi:MAG: phytanoyl-CoA dioxygenase family protein [Proteobacteria bacterium]|nr:phytanoyl-CoA dioxygenase family protein [Pseudomonadota bacterium]MDA1330950.1 phytanoyl-CoA dioxygenase family protein [Pseudomonadota bacterium]